MPYPNFTDPKELQLYLKALTGDEEATKMYCGSYMLIAKKGKLVKNLNDVFRYKGDCPPEGYVEIATWYNESIYDKDGFLDSKFWSVARLNV